MLNLAPISKCQNQIHALIASTNGLVSTFVNCPVTFAKEPHRVWALLQNVDNYSMDSTRQRWLDLTEQPLVLNL
jgi:hypothetical protein